MADAAAPSAPADVAQAEYIAADACTKLHGLGFGLVPPKREPGHIMHAPFALLPSPFPKSAFELAESLAVGFNELVDAIARDPAWLKATLAATGAADPFTGRLLGILDTVAAEGGPRQPLALGVHRSDYMVDRGPDGTSPPKLGQIELNTISSGFGALTQQICDGHRYVLSRYGGSLPLAARHLSMATAQGAGAMLTPPSLPGAGAEPAPAGKAAAALHGLIDTVLPPCASLVAVADGIGAAHAAYVVRHATGARTRAPVVLFVVQPNERNIMDQRLLEQAVFARHGLHVRRLLLRELHAVGRLRPGDSALLLPSEAAFVTHGVAAAHSDDEDDEVSVVYYRAGYTPNDYPGEEEWSARLLAERSLAVKCPSISYHLVGAKKVQQALAAPGVVERFVPPATAAALRSCFVGLWSLDPADVARDPSTAAAVADAIARPHLYVMKPQREGGGNNVYGPAIAAALAAPEAGGLQPHERAAYILMQRIFPRPRPTWLVRFGGVDRVPAVSELGVYSVFLSDGSSVSGGSGSGGALVNVLAGHLLRTKVEGTDEGGVAAGFAVLDSPMLVLGE